MLFTMNRGLIAGRRCICISAILMMVATLITHADRAHARDVSMDPVEIELAVGLHFASLEYPAMTALADRHGDTSIGPHVRVGLSLVEALSGTSIAEPSGFYLRDFCRAELGSGFILGPETDDSSWIDFRVELALQPIFAANPDTDFFMRAGYSTGANLTGSGLTHAIGDFDTLFATLGTRIGGLNAEVGYGVGALSDAIDNYQLLSLQVRLFEDGLFGDGVLQYWGVRFERTAGDGANSLQWQQVNLRLTATVY